MALSKETRDHMRGQLNLPELIQTMRVHQQTSVKRCGICNQPFKPKSKYILFCDSCKESSALYKYSDWLPDGSELLEMEAA